MKIKWKFLLLLLLLSSPSAYPRRINSPFENYQRLLQAYADFIKIQTRMVNEIERRSRHFIKGEYIIGSQERVLEEIRSQVLVQYFPDLVKVYNRVFQDITFEEAMEKPELISIKTVDTMRRNLHEAFIQTGEALGKTRQQIYTDLKIDQLGLRAYGRRYGIPLQVTNRGDIFIELFEEVGEGVTQEEEYRKIWEFGQNLASRYEEFGVRVEFHISGKKLPVYDIKIIDMLAAHVSVYILAVVVPDGSEEKILDDLLKEIRFFFDTQGWKDIPYFHWSEE